MKAKPKTPYQRLLEDITEWCQQVRFRRKVIMFNLTKDDLERGWTLADVRERTLAAEQLGYDVVLTADDEGLHAWYRKKVPEVPYEWRN